MQELDTPMAKYALITVAAALLTAPAWAETSRVSIAETSTYKEAVLCYQYYTLAAELAKKLEKNPQSSADQAAGFQLQAILARQLLALWSARIGEVKGARTQAQIDADVKALGAPMIADANAAIKGDQAAIERGAAVVATCRALERHVPVAAR